MIADLNRVMANVDQEQPFSELGTRHLGIHEDVGPLTGCEYSRGECELCIEKVDESKTTLASTGPYRNKRLLGVALMTITWLIVVLTARGVVVRELFWIFPNSLKRYLLIYSEWDAVSARGLLLDLISMRAQESDETAYWCLNDAMSERLEPWFVQVYHRNVYSMDSPSSYSPWPSIDWIRRMDASTIRFVITRTGLPIDPKFSKEKTQEMAQWHIDVRCALLDKISIGDQISDVEIMLEKDYFSLGSLLPLAQRCLENPKKFDETAIDKLSTLVATCRDDLAAEPKLNAVRDLISEKFAKASNSSEESDSTTAVLRETLSRRLCSKLPSAGPSERSFRRDAQRTN